IEGKLEDANTAFNTAVEISQRTIQTNCERLKYEWITIYNAFKAKGDLERATSEKETVVKLFDSLFEIDSRNDTITQISDLIHPRTYCGECKRPIRGYRFYCLECPYYEACES